MTCNDYKTFLDKEGVMTVSEAFAALKHEEACEGCYRHRQRLFQEQLARISPAEMIHHQALALDIFHRMQTTEDPELS